MEKVDLHPPDYILAGKATKLSRWADAASDAGILWCCKQHQAENCPPSDHGCGCGICDTGVVQNVFLIRGATNFDGGDYEQLLLLTPNKQSLHADPASCRALVLKLLSALGSENVACFRSSKSAGGTKWVRLE